jgi:hypothetical protein
MAVEYLPDEQKYILGRNISFTNSINSLERGIWLKRRSLTKILPGKFNLDFDLPSVYHQFGQLLLGDHGNFLVTIQHICFVQANV